MCLLASAPGRAALPEGGLLNAGAGGAAKSDARKKRAGAKGVVKAALGTPSLK